MGIVFVLTVALYVSICVLTGEIVSFVGRKIGAAFGRIPIGTKSLLFGAHAFYLHPIYAMRAWIHIEGWTLNPAVWLSVFVHDFGYWGCRDIDGEDGKKHPEFGARVMRFLDCPLCALSLWGPTIHCSRKWHDFCLYHSRSYSRSKGANPSRLCAPDKLSFKYQIKWLYIFMTELTGELDEYMTHAVQLGEIEEGDSSSLWYDKLVKISEEYSKCKSQQK